MLRSLHPSAPTDPVSEIHRHAYNAAFQELDLNWHWDAATFARLQPYGRAGVRSWVQTEQPHLLRAYDIDFLVEAIESAKANHHARMLHQRPAQPINSRAA